MAATDRTEEKMVLLVGATGRLGSRIARTLLSKGVGVRALCRPASAHAPLKRLGAEIAFGDLRDPASLAAACAGIGTVLTTANTARRAGDDTVAAVDRQGTSDLIDAAASAGVRHFIYVSVLNASEQSPVPFMAAKGENERRLRESGMPWTILAPNLFMDSWVTQVVGQPALSGRPVTLIGEARTRHTFVAEHDVAEFATAVVNNHLAANRRLAIGGPEALTWRDVVATYERVLGRPLEIRFEPPGQTVGTLPVAVQPLLAAMDRFETDFDTRTIASEFGVSLSPFEPWVRASVAAAQGRV
jgi:uncharacterized protein YbjT (DUF2867 family)